MNEMREERLDPAMGGYEKVSLQLRPVHSYMQPCLIMIGKLVSHYTGELHKSNTGDRLKSMSKESLLMTRGFWTGPLQGVFRLFPNRGCLLAGA